MIFSSIDTYLWGSLSQCTYSASLTTLISVALDESLRRVHMNVIIFSTDGAHSLKADLDLAMCWTCRLGDVPRGGGMLRRARITSKLPSS